MSRVLTFMVLLATMLWSTANFDKMAQIVGEKSRQGNKDVRAHFDHEGRLWITARKDSQIPTIAKGVNGDVQVQVRVPCLHFWLYDEHASLVNEGTLADSVETCTLVPVVNGGCIAVWRTLLDFGSLLDPPPGYVSAAYIDRNGVIREAVKIDPGNYFFRIDGSLSDKSIAVTLRNLWEFKFFVISVDDDWIAVSENNQPIPRLTPDHRKFRLAQTIDSVKYFGWSLIDTATRFARDEFSDRVVWADHIIIRDMIQIGTYDISSRTWEIDRYSIPSSSWRKFEDFSLYPLRSTSSTKDIPDVQSVRLHDGNIAVTILAKEGDGSVAYQMLFDSLGQYIAPAATELLKPRDISEIPDGSHLFVRHSNLSRAKSGAYRGIYVYMWGYDGNGKLYWKRYHVD